VTSSVAVTEAAIWVKSMYMKNHNEKKRKKEKIWKLKHKPPSKRRFLNGIYSLLMRADARGSADTIY